MIWDVFVGLHWCSNYDDTDTERNGFLMSIFTLFSLNLSIVKPNPSVTGDTKCDLSQSVYSYCFLPFQDRFCAVCYNNVLWKPRWNTLSFSYTIIHICIQLCSQLVLSQLFFFFFFFLHLFLSMLLKKDLYAMWWRIIALCFPWARHFHHLFVLSITVYTLPH